MAAISVIDVVYHHHVKSNVQQVNDAYQMIWTVGQKTVRKVDLAGAYRLQRTKNIMNYLYRINHQII